MNSNYHLNCFVKQLNRFNWNLNRFCLYVPNYKFHTNENIFKTFKIIADVSTYYRENFSVPKINDPVPRSTWKEQ